MRVVLKPAESSPHATAFANAGGPDVLLAGPVPSVLYATSRVSKSEPNVLIVIGPPVPVTLNQVVWPIWWPSQNPVWLGVNGSPAAIDASDVSCERGLNSGRVAAEPKLSFEGGARAATPGRTRIVAATATSASAARNPVR